jgi:hypothetical protein
MKTTKNLMIKIQERIRIYLSHRPGFYALIVGIGIVLFWRGIWHSADFLHTFFTSFQSNLTTDALSSTWWDGPLSFIVGIIVLFFTGAFTSSFIGNELILSGLRGEKRLSQKTETEVKGEEEFILEIKQELGTMTEKIQELEKEIHKKELK